MLDHITHIVQDYLQQEAIELLPWSAMSPDMNLIEHLSDYLGRKVNARTPKCQNIQELGTALVQGWQQYTQHRLRRFQELYRMRGGYTRY
jgi:hypothetical protein